MATKAKKPAAKLATKKKGGYDRGGGQSRDHRRGDGQ